MNYSFPFFAPQLIEFKKPKAITLSLLLGLLFLMLGNWMFSGGEFHWFFTAQSNDLEKIIAKVGDCETPFKGKENFIGIDYCKDTFGASVAGNGKIIIKLENPNDEAIEVKLDYPADLAVVHSGDSVIKNGNMLRLPGADKELTFEIRLKNISGEQKNFSFGIKPMRISQEIELNFQVDHHQVTKLEYNLTAEIYENGKKLTKDSILIPGIEYELRLDNPNFHELATSIKLDETTKIRFAKTKENFIIKSAETASILFSIDEKLKEPGEVNIPISFVFEGASGRINLKQQIGLSSMESTENSTINNTDEQFMIPFMIFSALTFILGWLLLRERKKKYFLQVYKKKIRSSLNTSSEDVDAETRHISRWLENKLYSKKVKEKYILEAQNDLHSINEKAEKAAGNTEKNYSTLTKIRTILSLEEDNEIGQANNLMTGLNEFENKFGINISTTTIAPELSKRIDALRAKVEEDKKQATGESSKEVKKLKEEKRLLEEEIATVTENLGLKKEQLPQQLQTLNSKLNNLSSSLKNNFSRDKGVIAKLDQVASHINILDEQLNSRNEEINNLKRDLTKNKREVKSKESTITQYKTDLKKLENYKSLAQQELGLQDENKITKLATYLKMLEGLGVVRTDEDAKKRIELWNRQEETLNSLWQSSRRGNNKLSVNSSADLDKIKEQLISKVNAGPSDVPPFVGQFQEAMDEVLSGLETIRKKMKPDSYFEEHVDIALEGRGRQRGIRKLIQDLSDRKNGGAFFRSMKVGHVDDYMKIKPDDFYDKFIKRYLLEFNSIGVLKAYADAEVSHGLSLPDLLKGDRIEPILITQTYEYMELGLKDIGVEIKLPKLLHDIFDEREYRDGQVSNLKEKIIGHRISSIPTGIIYDVLEIGINKKGETLIKPKVVYKYNV